MTFWEAREQQKQLKSSLNGVESNNSQENLEKPETKEDQEKNKELVVLKNFEREVTIANNNMYNLISKYPDLVSHISEGLNKNPSQNQLFLELWYIVWETKNYLEKNDKSTYEETLPFLSEYINIVNEAKQPLKLVNFYDWFKDLPELIKEAADKLPKKISKRHWDNPFNPERTFYMEE